MATRNFATGNSVNNPAIYRRICENSLPGILMSYRDYRLISANPMACALFGMTEEEICSHFLTDLVEYSDPRFINLVEIAERTGKANGEITLVRKDGSKFTCRINSSTFSNEDGELTIVVEIREPNNRRKEEEELSKNFTLYQLAFDSTNDGIWDSDMKTNRIFLSPNAIKLLGYTEPKTLHRDELFDHIIHKDDLTDIKNEFDPIINGPEDTIDIEFRANAGAAGWKWIRLRGKVVLRDREGKAIRMLGTIADISKRKLTEKELERKQKEFQSYFDCGTIGQAIILPDKSWKAINQKACQLLGYSKDELTGLTWIDLTHPEDVQKSLFFFNQALEGKIDNYNFEKRYIRKDGSIVFAHAHVVCSQNEDGSVKHFLGSYIDITEQKLYEKTIRDERNLLRTLIDNLPFTVYVIDKDGCKVKSNKADQETIGYLTEAEVLGKTDIELFPGETGERGHADNMRVINTGLPILNLEEDFIDRNNQQKWLLTTKVPLFDSNNIISGLIGIGVDVTEQRKLQQQIIESETFYRTLVDISPNGIIVTDLKGEITFLSKKMYQIFKAPAHENFIGESIFKWVTPESVEAVITHFKEVTEALRTPLTREYKCFRYDKSEFWGEFCSSSLTDASENPTGLMIVCRDISDRKEAEEKLISALNTAEESDKLKTALLRNISHEIRTPMNAIVGFSSLLGDSGNSEETMLSYIEIIQGSSNQLLSIINDLVDISKIEAKIVKKNISGLNLNEMMLSIYNQFEKIVTHKNIGLNITMGLSHDRANIKTDRTKLVQIISNLLSNAIKFTGQGQINFGYTMENQFVKFYVSDTGIGIPSEYHSKIFSPFFQVQYSIDKNVEGTGLGLSICKAYVELLGGTLSVSSKMGKGSSFHFTIPYEPEELPDLSKQTDLNGRESVFPKALKVLIAEDDENNLKYLLSLFTDLKVKTILAENGKEAVARCQEQKEIDLVLMDLNMPVMDGFMATELIKKHNPQLPVIVQSAFVAEREKAIAYGCDDFISKPYKKEELITMFRKHLKPKLSDLSAAKKRLT